MLHFIKRLFARAVLCLFSNPKTHLRKADRLALQTREVRLMLSLDVLEACKKLFRDFRGPPIGAQFRHDLDLPCHAGGTLANMAADHLQIRLFPPHVLSCLSLETLT